MKIFFIVFGSVLEIVGVLLSAKGLRYLAAVKKSRTVTAKIVDSEKEVSGYNPNHRRSHRISVRAVYEYCENGEVKRFTNPIASAVQENIGTKATLYIDEDGTVREKNSAGFTLVFAAILAFGGFVMIMTALTTF